MEFVNGRTLKEVLAAEGRLQPRRALEITADICAALEFSHRHGIIHRDIKPGNVMLTQNGQVKVMDFGIARALASGATTMTQTSAVIGTAQYLSPGAGPRRGGRRPLRRVRGRLRALRAALSGTRRSSATARSAWPTSTCGKTRRRRATSTATSRRTIDAIVLKALAKNPLNRYQSAQEMRADVLRAVAGRPVLATPVMTEAETDGDGRAAARQRAGATTMPPADAGAGCRRGRRERQASSWVMAVLAALGVLAVVALGVGAGLAQQRRQRPTTPTTVPCRSSSA